MSDMSPEEREEREKTIKEQANLAFGEAITWSTRNDLNNKKVRILNDKSELSGDILSQISSFLTKEDHKALITSSAMKGVAEVVKVDNNKNDETRKARKRKFDDRFFL